MLDATARMAGEPGCVFVSLLGGSRSGAVDESIHPSHAAYKTKRAPLGMPF
jgi:hypothetical protein